VAVGVGGVADPSVTRLRGARVASRLLVQQVTILRENRGFLGYSRLLGGPAMSAIGSTFRTDEPHLHELLEEVHKGQIQLPDFQRGWVWDDDHIRALIASVSLSYPIGAVMLLEAGGAGVRFKPRLFEGVELSGRVDPARLALDGQQRLTSLYMALRSGKPVQTRTGGGPVRPSLASRPTSRDLSPVVVLPGGDGGRSWR
jgi:hypothetical protein